MGQILKLPGEGAPINVEDTDPVRSIIFCSSVFLADIILEFFLVFLLLSPTRVFSRVLISINVYNIC